MGKPTVYLDTSIISAFCYTGRDVEKGVRRAQTREWWEWECGQFEVWVSRFVEIELRAGAFAAQADCVTMVRRCRFLPITQRAKELRDAILACGIVPLTKSVDASHLAVSCFHEIDYLLSWNYAHLANPITQERLDELCLRFQLSAPWVVSPESIPQSRFGQSIRRKR